MQQLYQIKNNKASLLEKFGMYYLNFFKKFSKANIVFTYTDEVIAKKVTTINLVGILLASLVGALCVYPTVWVDIYLAKAPFFIHYGWVGIVTVVSIAIELYFLFIIALRSVYKVSLLINLNASESDLVHNGLFSIKNILARTALELPDPEMKLMGIDPFKRVSKKNLLLLSIIYKGKIFLTNILSKYFLLYFVGNAIMGISILYFAILVECFWNSVVIIRVVKEARLRLFGFALANQIGSNFINDGMIEKLSPLTKKNCLRAIGNAVVMTQNYHPNMVILFIKFQQMLKITEVEQYDNWDMFVSALQNASEPERYFLLDLFTVAAAFDGKLSTIENNNFTQAYGIHTALYTTRLHALTNYLQSGKLHAALAECKLNFTAG